MYISRKIIQEMADEFDVDSDAVWAFLGGKVASNKIAKTTNKVEKEWQGGAAKVPKKVKTEKSEKTEKKISGYRLFQMENSEQIKKNAEKGQGGHMKAAGAMWKSLDSSDKELYNRRAKAM